MKKFLILLLAVMLSGMAYSQYYLDIYGYVNMVDSNFIMPVPNQEVIITIDSTNTGYTFYDTVYTNDNGFYQDEVVPGQGVNYGFVTVRTLDPCLNAYQVQQQFFAPGVTLMQMDFYLCNTVPTCQAMFLYYNDPVSPFTYTFNDVSMGNYTDVLWSFGDSTYSAEPNPVHTYERPGVYTVCLTISGQDCSSTYCETLYVQNGGGGCENYFNWYPTDPNGTTIAFEGYLMNGQQALSYIWDFGDGNTGEGQYIEHAYEIGPNGNTYFLVTLTTVVSDSMGTSCTSTSWQEVYLYTQNYCYAYYYYYPDSTDIQTIHFQDMSYTANGTIPDSWNWDFGDSTFSNEQNPVHNYADTGAYYVCLTIYDSMENCTDTYCELVYVGTYPPWGCESYFTTFNQYGLTVDLQAWTMSPYQTEYTWEFGDGTTGTGQYVSHTFPNYGIFMVTLSSVDQTGCAWVSTQEVWLDSLYMGCNNYFYYEQSDSTTFTFTGQVYYNNGLIYPDSVTVYSWDFGDGTTGTGQTVTHYFQTNPSGVYTVCLTTTTSLPDGTTCTATTCQDIWVVQPNLSIYGYVYLGNNLSADYATVHLMTLDTLWQGVVEVATTSTSNNGWYEFQNVPLFNGRLYYVLAELTDSSAYAGEYLPTYYISALNWESADPILPLLNWTADVYMIPATAMGSGNGTITGSVNNLGARGTMEGVEVVLLDPQMNPYSYTRSDAQGNFQFDNLPMGSYIIHAEIMGIHTNEATVTLSESQPEVTVEIQVSGGEANVVFGIHEQKVTIEKVGDIYPNPVNANSRMDISMAEPTIVTISIFNQLGQLVQNTQADLATGTHTISIQTTTLQPGLYLLRISTEQGDLVAKRFVKAD